MTNRSYLTVPDPAGVRLGPLWLSPGVTAGNAGTLLFGAFSTICLVTFISFIQPYLFGVIGIPATAQGALAGLLMGLVNLAAFAGALWVRQRDAAIARVIGPVAGSVRPID